MRNSAQTSHNIEDSPPIICSNKNRRVQNVCKCLTQRHRWNPGTRHVFSACRIKIYFMVLCKVKLTFNVLRVYRPICSVWRISRGWGFSWFFSVSPCKRRLLTQRRGKNKGRWRSDLPRHTSLPGELSASRSGCFTHFKEPPLSFEH